jgi:hypothetical protein
VDELIQPPQTAEREPPARDAAIEGAAEQGLSPAAAEDDPDIGPVAEASLPVALADDQLESLLAQIEGDEKPADLQDTLADAFWEEALGTDSENATPGLSLDEARDQGLIGPEFDIDEG